MIWISLMFSKFSTIYFMLVLSACGTAVEKPTGLMTEFIRHPEHVRILDSKPEFTWIVPDNASEQTAYQIRVASSYSSGRKTG